MSIHYVYDCSSPSSSNPPPRPTFWHIKAKAKIKPNLHAAGKLDFPLICTENRKHIAQSSASLHVIYPAGHRLHVCECVFVCVCMGVCHSRRQNEGTFNCSQISSIAYLTPAQKCTHIWVYVAPSNKAQGNPRGFSYLLKTEQSKTQLKLYEIS